MKICTISDTHGYHGELELPECDLLIHAGDFTMMGYDHEIEAFNLWLGKQKAANKFKHAIVIPGNHELSMDHNHRSSNAAKAMNHRKLITNAELLVDEVTEYQGLKIYGSPATPRFFDWAFNFSHKDLVEKWKKIPSDADIVITHGPPYGTLDMPSPRKGNVGCIALAMRLDEIQPKLHVFGHIHGGYGRVDKKTIYINAASVDELYSPGNDPIVVEL